MATFLVFCLLAQHLVYTLCGRRGDVGVFLLDCYCACPHAGSVDEQSYEDMYESYLVEVQSQRPMLFNFNTPRQNHQRLQFLYSESTSLSHLLLFRHKESIDVYAIHTGPGHQVRLALATSYVARLATPHLPCAQCNIAKSDGP